MKQLLNVEGMSCGHCITSIEGALKEQTVKAKVDLSQETVEVDYDEAKIPMDLIKETIEDLGYEVK